MDRHGNNIGGVRDIKCAGKAAGHPAVDSSHYRVGVPSAALSLIRDPERSERIWWEETGG
jgi:hypothetical protein